MIIFTLITLYTLFLVQYEDDDFTGLLKIHENINDLKNNKKESREEKIRSKVDKILDRLSFVLITVSTVGYGDVIPKKRSLRIINSIFIIILIYITFN